MLVFWLKIVILATSESPNFTFIVIAVNQKFLGQRRKVPVTNFKLPVTTFFLIDREISNLPVTFLEKITVKFLSLPVTIFDNIPVKSQKCPWQNFTEGVSRALLVVTGEKTLGKDVNSFLYQSLYINLFSRLWTKHIACKSQVFHVFTPSLLNDLPSKWECILNIIYPSWVRNSCSKTFTISKFRWISA